MNRRDEKGLKQGKWKGRFPTSVSFNSIIGANTFELNYKDDKMHGLCRYYYDSELGDNLLESEGYYNNNKKDGLWVFFNKIGYITENIYYFKNDSEYHVSYSGRQSTPIYRRFIL